MDRVKVKERRSHVRAPLTMPVKLRVEGAQEDVAFETSSVSAGGIFVETPDPFPTGTKVNAQIYLASINITVEAKGAVVRSLPERNKQEGPPGMGIQFTEHGQIGWRFLVDLVESYEEAQNPE